jgi:hypothetical protein
MEVSGQLYVPALLHPKETAHDTDSIWGGVDPRAGLYAMDKIEMYYPSRESNPASSVVQLVA